MTIRAELERVMALVGKATPGEWFTGHLCNDSHSCTCPYIFSDCQNGMGAIATVGVTNEEVATLDEAKANQALIAAAVNLVRNPELLAMVAERDGLADVIENLAYATKGRMTQSLGVRP